MKRLLTISSSVFDTKTSRGVSSELVDRIATGLLKARPDLQRQSLDFTRQPVPHLDSDWLQALHRPEAERSADQQRMAAYSDALVAQLQEADVLVIGAPMYNFSVPSMLKAWIDHVARAGVSFRYTENGPQGLLGTKKVYIVVSSGGVHEEGISDHVRPWLRTMLGLLGLDDVTFVLAAGVNLGEQPRAEAIARAQEQIDGIVEQWSTAGDLPALLQTQPGSTAREEAA